MFVLTRPTRRATVPYADRALDGAYNRFFDESVNRLLGTSAGSARTAALDVSESDTAFILAFDVPGVTREQLKVTVEGRRVSLESIDAPVAESADPAEAAPAAAEASAAPRVLYRERSAARYARTVSLPAEVDQATSQARFENGVLTLTLAKKVPTGATRLSIS